MHIKGKIRKLVYSTVLLSAVVLFGDDIVGYAQESPETYTLSQIVVTASRMEEELEKVPARVEVITREQIEHMPGLKIDQLLRHVSGVNSSRTSMSQMRPVIGLRGLGSFEQGRTLVLMDGVPINKTDSGGVNWHCLNPDDIERIEIVKGPAARIYGPNAVGGVINIITRDVNSNSFGGHGAYGEYGYYDIGAQAALSSDKVSGRLSANQRYSSGYLEGKDTDFDIKTINYKGILKNGSNKFRLGMGFTDKDFGAYKFYSDTFPDQREKTETFLLYGNAEIKMADVEVVPRIHWRHHKDEFKININGVWNLNDHRTDVFGAQVNTLITSGLGVTSIGGEAELEDMESSSLGDHNRGRQSIFVEHRLYPSDKLTIGMGASAVHYSSWGWECWPGADMSIELTDGLTWFTSFEKSFRVPTYTEFYYTAQCW